MTELLKNCNKIYASIRKLGCKTPNLWSYYAKTMSIVAVRPVFMVVLVETKKQSQRNICNSVVTWRINFGVRLGNAGMQDKRYSSWLKIWFDTYDRNFYFFDE